MFKLLFGLITISLAAAPISLTPPKAEETTLYLTWVRDPTTTMTIQWHSEGKTDTRVHYKKTGEEGWRQETGSDRPLTDSTLYVHTVELTHLAPNTTYTFKVGENTASHRFRTLPASLDERPVRFAIGGDAYCSLALFRKMNAQIAKQNPDFVVVAGDIAYTRNHGDFFRGSAWEVKRWGTFFAEWKKQLVTDDGRLIPMIPLLGNHDIAAKPNLPFYFFELFALPTQNLAYRTLDCGNYLSLFLLDSGHAAPIEGKQTEWLKESLAARTAVPHRMAIYHIAAYPSSYSYEERGLQAEIRRHWCPLFDAYNIPLAFEHHNHTFKRTYPLKAGQIDPAGTTYLGDGSWGCRPRQVHPDWYLAKALPLNAFWLATLSPSETSMQAIDIQGNTFDSLQLPNTQAITNGKN
jgi:hypothetical protein